jgi:integrase
MGERLFKRPGGRVWQAYVKERGKWKTKSTHCTDKRAAEHKLADLERAAANPALDAARQTTTRRILEEYLASKKRIGRAAGTLHHVRIKSQALVTLLPTLAEDITHPACERYIDARLAQGVMRTTILKELRVLKPALKLARRNGLWFGEPDDVIPELDDDSTAGTRTLSAWELIAVCGAITARRMAIVAFAAATGCDPGAIWRARPADVAPDFSAVQIHGTKRETRERTVPLALPSQRLLVAWALEHADGGPDGTLFSPWANMRRDLGIAARKLGVPPFNATDLRRTFGTMLRNAGVEPQLIAPAMGHVDGRQVERVYGKLTPEALSTLLTARVGQDFGGRVMSPATPSALPPGGGSEEPGTPSGVVNREDPPSPPANPEGARYVRGGSAVQGGFRGTGEDRDPSDSAEKPRISRCAGTESNRRHGDFQSCTQTSPTGENAVGFRAQVDGSARLMRGKSAGVHPAPWVHEAVANLYELAGAWP